MMHHRTEGPGYTQEQYQGSDFLAECSPVYVKRMGSLWSRDGFRWEKINREVNLHFITAGCGTLQIDGIDHEVKAGDVFILYPNTDTRYWDHPGHRWRYDWITLALPPPYASLRLAGFTPAQPVRAVPPDAPVWELVKKLRLTFRHGHFGPLYPAVAAWELLESLVQTAIPPEAGLAERIRRHIDQADPLPEVKELARHFGVARSTIYRAFAAAYREPVKTYLDRLRFDNACELLRDTEFSVIRIAAACGFSSPQYFCRAFHARFDRTPAEWRKENRN